MRLLGLFLLEHLACAIAFFFRTLDVSLNLYAGMRTADVDGRSARELRKIWMCDASEGALHTSAILAFSRSSWVTVAWTAVRCCCSISRSSSSPSVSWLPKLSSMSLAAFSLASSA